MLLLLARPLLGRTLLNLALFLMLWWKNALFWLFIFVFSDNDENYWSNYATFIINEHQMRQ